jgi:hypothetical protein
VITALRFIRSISNEGQMSTGAPLNGTIKRIRRSLRPGL